MISYRSSSRHSSFSLIVTINVLIFFTDIYSGQTQAQEGPHSLGTNNGSVLLDKGTPARRDDIPAMVASLSGSSDMSPAVEYDDQESLSSSLFDGLLTKRHDWHLKLDQANRFRLDWTVDYPANRIEFALSINLSSSNFREGSDVFALGFSTYGQLNSSDFCLAWYDLSHRVHLQDARTDSEHRLELVDSSRSVCKLLATNSGFPKVLNEKNKTPTTRHLQLQFERPLDVCNAAAGEEASKGFSYYTIDNGTTHLVWFTLRGPLLSIDGSNLKELENASNGKAASSKTTDKQPSLHASQHDKDNVHGKQLQQFESGMKRVQLIASRAGGDDQSKRPSSSRSSRNLSLDIRMNQFKIPAQETTYWCKLFKLPHKFEMRRYHITKFEAVIEKKNEHVVHHMELFHCANLNAQQESELDILYDAGGWTGDCNGPTRPKPTEPCRRVILAWAMGAHPLEYPEQVGQSIGGLGYSPYVVLEVHYNNVGSTLGLIDSSGLEFQYTSKLRQFDAGIMEIGLEYSDKVSIPPNLIAPIAGHCASECTRVAMAESGNQGQLQTSQAEPQSEASAADLVGEEDDDTDRGDEHRHRNHRHHLRRRAQHQHQHNQQQQAENHSHQQDGIYIFAAQMHTHLVGVASWTEHVRGGRLMGELQRDNHYSPHFQEIRLLPKPVHVVPGDALIHYCLYDTTNRVNITLGGFSTSDEMCVSYLHYYPRLDLEVCKSSVDSSALEAYFAYLAREEGQKTSIQLRDLRNSANLSAGETNNTGQLSGSKDIGSSIKSVSENYKSIEWSRRRSEELIQFYSNAPLSIQCNRSNGARFPGYWTGATPTKLWPDWTAGQSSDGIEHLTSSRATGRELVGYRGREHGRRHAQCARA